MCSIKHASSLSEIPAIIYTYYAGYTGALHLVRTNHAGEHMHRHIAVVCLATLVCKDSYQPMRNRNGYHTPGRDDTLRPCRGRNTISLDAVSVTGGATKAC